jgi:indole-3-glycerol phosphate synthase
MSRNFEIIAEVKTESPFGFKSEKTWDELFLIANKFGDMISIHTDKRWGGSYELIKKAKTMTSKPILAKGIHKNDSDIEKAIEAGADYVLVVGRIPKVYLNKVLIEPNTLKDLEKIPLGLKVVWNARDLETGEQKKETYDEARKIYKGWLCQASFIKTIADVKEGADAVLVGEHLEEFVKSLEK